ncbi:MAG: HTH domain-containing protein [Oscillospiraceae bacterium]|nr:HTH domain-containing protein [Oscillospiraceae bacterium]
MARINGFQRLLLERLREAGQPVSAQFLANGLGVSERTVRSHLKELDQDLRDVGAAVFSRTGVGFWLEVTDGEALEELLQDKGREPSGFAMNAVRKARSHLLVRYFLCQEGYASMEELEAVLFMGRTAVRQLLAQARTILGRSGLELVTVPRQGMGIKGSEHDIRTCIAYEADQIRRFSLPLSDRERYAEIYSFRGEKMDRVRKLIRRELGIRANLSEYSIEYLARLIWISVIRDGSGAELTYSPEALAEQEGSRFYPTVRRLLEECGQTLEWAFTPADAALVTAAVRGLRTVVRVEEISEKRRPELRKAAVEVIREMARCNGFQAMGSDELLPEHICCYLAAFFHRSRYHIRTAQFSGEVAARCSLMAKKMATQAFLFMEKRFKVNISEEEILRLAMILRPYFGRFPRIPKPARCCCVSNIDKAVGRGLAERLIRNFGRYIQSMDILELYELREKGGGDYEVVFTSYPPGLLDFLPEGVRLIQAGPYFDERDKARILRTLSNMDQEGDITACWRPECLFTEVEATDQDACLKVIQEKLAELGKVKGNVREDLLLSEMHLASRPVNNAVIISGLQSHLPRATAAAFLLKKPIQWGTEDSRAQVVVYWDQGEEPDRYRLVENEFLPHVLEMVFYDQNVVEALLRRPDHGLVMRAIEMRDKEIMTFSSNI